MNSKLNNLSIIAFILICMQFIFTISYAPPKLVTTPTNSQTQFNGQNALTTLKQILPNNAPHPASSPANKIIRDLIITQLKTIGLTPEIQPSNQCRGSRCRDIENIIAIQKGTSTAPALLLMVHYDSTNHGPGAGDDMAAVATLLENAAQVAKAPPLNNSIIYLFTDGEEMGLLGAKAFAQEHSLYKTVGLTANFEGRGNSGPSVLFETGNTSGDVIKQFIKHSTAPGGSSLFATVYDNMPNSTDFTIFKRLGMNGLNFAYTGSPRHYHSAQDTVENLNKDSLQHQGQNQLDIIRAFGNQDLTPYLPSNSTATNRVFFDVYSTIYFSWSVDTSWLFIGFIILTFLFLTFTALKTKQARISRIFIAIPIAIISIVALLAAAYLLKWPLAIWPELQGLDHAAPLAPRLSLLFTSLFIATITATILSKFLNSKELEFGYWALIIGMVITIQIYLAGAIYWLLMPSLTFVLTRLINSLTTSQLIKNINAIILLIVCAYFATSLAQMLEAAVNFDMAFVLIAPMLLLLPPLTSLIINFTPSARIQALITASAATVIMLVFTTISNPNF